MKRDPRKFHGGPVEFVGRKKDLDAPRAQSGKIRVVVRAGEVLMPQRFGRWLEAHPGCLPEGKSGTLQTAANSTPTLSGPDKPVNTDKPPVDDGGGRVREGSVAKAGLGT